MKNFEFLLCFILCIVQYVITQDETANDTSQRDIETFAKAIGITREDFKECLDKVHMDLDTILELSGWMLTVETPRTRELVKTIGCLEACLYKKKGVLVNNQIFPEKILDHLPNSDRRRQALELMRAQFTKCRKHASNQTDECEIVISFNRCVWQGVTISI